MDALTTIETTDDSGRKVMTFVTPPRCKVGPASGVVKYAKADGWIGVALDGETTISGKQRVDEYLLTQVTIDPVISAHEADRRSTVLAAQDDATSVAWPYAIGEG